jgi:hypothetical protein
VQEAGGGEPPVTPFPDPPPGDSYSDTPPEHPPGRMCHDSPSESAPEEPESATDSSEDSPGDTCPVPYFPLGGGFAYQSPGKVPPYYCPREETITEPGHPYSPRHDIVGRDRDYSSETSKKIDDPTTCGDAEDWAFSDWNVEGARDEQNKEAYPIVQCGIVPVDILSFRAEAFNSCIMERINYNFNTYIEQWIKTGAHPPLMTKDDGSEINPGFNPPCKMRFYETDQPDNDTGCPVKMSIQQCCRIIVKDVVPANFVKLRTCEGLRYPRIQQYGMTNIHDPYPAVNTPIGAGTYFTQLEKTKELNQIVCSDTEPSEYQFKSHFGEFHWPYDGKLVGYNMPYMRWWDTGVSAGQEYHGGSFVNTLGGFDTLIGVGREERDQNDVEKATQYAAGFSSSQLNTDQRLQNYTSPQQAEMGRWGGWSELKAHEMWTIRRNNLFCIGRYEKLFKPGDAESLAEAMGGSGYTSTTSVQWPWSLGHRGYASDSHGNAFPFAYHSPSQSSIIKGLDNALQGDIIVYNVKGVPRVAYVSGIGGFAFEGDDVPLPDLNVKAEFNANTGRFELNALGGPVLHPTRLYIHTWDDGKFPTSTGNSIMWGMGPERTMYKVAVPTYYSDEICDKTMRAMTAPPDHPEATACRNPLTLDPGQCRSLHCQPTCEDSDYSACVLPDISAWQNALIYRPRVDTNIARCPDSGVPVDPTGPAYNLQATYDWPGPTYQPDIDAFTKPIVSIKPGSLPGPTVINQSVSSKIFTNTWANCVNSGYDPPRFWSKGYSGAQTGAITYTALCGPKWYTKPPQQPANSPPQRPDLENGCSAATNVYKFFPATSR